MTSAPDIPNPTPSHTRLMQLDVLRGVAILMVLLRHSSPKWALLPYYYAGPLSRIMLFVGNIGWTGVDLFFVLSGFLIGGLLFREIKKTGRLDVRRFLIRRGLKIWPAYFFFLLVVLILASRDIGFRAAFHALIPNFIHLQNYLGSPHGITWSLAVEEHFYLALPLFLLVIIPRRRHDGSMPAIPIAAAVLIVVCTALRFTNWNRPFDMYIQQTPTHLRIDGLFFGVLLAYLFHIKPALLARIARHRLVLLSLGAALLAPMGFYDVPDHRWIWTIGYTMIYIGYGCILIACLFSPPGDLLGNLLASRAAAVLAWVGVFSYSIYLWQFEISYIPIHKWVLRRLPHHPLSLYWLVGTAIYLLAAILGGALLARIVEFPVLKLRDRLFPARADAIPVAPATANEAESSTLLPVVSAPN